MSEGTTSATTHCLRLTSTSWPGSGTPATLSTVLVASSTSDIRVLLGVGRLPLALGSIAPQFVQCVFNSIGRLLGRLVLPNSHHLPTCFGQSTVRIAIPPAIGLDLVTPECSIAFGPGSMHRTAMPEAAVDEDGEP